MQLQKATRKRQYLRLGFIGPTGGGKTFTALRMAHAMAARVGGRVAVIDAEEGTSELYAGEANPDGGLFDFDVINLSKEPGKFRVENYLSALATCQKAGVKVVVIDSMSHAWAGEGGVLEFIDRKGDNGGNKFAGWKEATPLQHKFVNTILAYPGHILGTMRVKTEWVIETNDKGKKVPRRIGLQPVQREGLEYEFTCIFDFDWEKRLTVGKTRVSRLDGYSEVRAGANVANALMDWLDEAAATPEAPAAEPEPSAGDEPAKEGHHPSFTRPVREAFMGTIGRIPPGMVYEVVAAVSEERSERRVRPSAMTPEERSGLLRFLRTDKGRAAYDAKAAALASTTPPAEATNADA